MTRQALMCVAFVALTTAVPATAQQPQAEDAPGRDSYWYGQLLYGSVAEGARYRSPGLAIGHRREREHLALDLRLFSAQVRTTSPDLHTYGGTYTQVFAGSLLTLQAFHVLRPRAPQTWYLGGGVGLSGIYFGRWGDVDDEWNGRGPEARATAGYAFRRSDTSTRWFFETGLAVPVRALQRSTRRGAPEGTRRVYPWTLALGVGW